MQLQGQHWKHASLDQREADKRLALSQQAPQIMPSHSHAQHAHIVATEWTTKTQLEQPQKALPLMISHRNTSWPLTTKSAENWPNFWHKRPGTSREKVELRPRVSLHQNKQAKHQPWPPTRQEKKPRHSNKHESQPSGGDEAD